MWIEQPTYSFVLCQVQAEGQRGQEVHRHPDREGVPGAPGRGEGHVQLPGLNAGMYPMIQYNNPTYAQVNQNINLAFTIELVHLPT